MNITDVDDKIIRNAVAQHKTLDEYTAIYTKAFLDDCATLRLEQPERLVRATEHIKEMADAIHKLEEGRLHLSQRRFGILSHCEISKTTANFRITISAAWSPARASMWITTIRPMPAISLSGKRLNPASRPGIRRPATDAPAGISNVP